MNEIIVGIDLGTTNSEVAIVQDGKVVVITDETNNKILPSFVGVSENNEVLVGTPAKNQYVLYPERTVKSIKRKMGEDVKVDMAGQLYTPQEISAMILKRLKQIAENYLKQPVNKAVITVPAYFSDSQRQATREAGQIAGLEVVRIINEPTAAALVYESQQKDQKRVLVYDLGGGTFDVSVVSIQDNVVEVVASHGNNKLGGDDFDQKIIDYVTVHLKEKYGEGLTLSRKAIARITRAAEAAKIVLSNQPYSIIEEEYLDEYQGNPVHLSLELSRVVYESMITIFIDETLEAVHIALDSAKLKTSDIDEILLVGGSTRTPLVSERLEKELRIAPRSEIDPDLCVASGAAIQAAMIAGQNVTAVLVDITPYTFGTSAIGELNGEFYPYKYVPIIHKNSALPMTKTEAFYTVHDNQESVDIRIYQGENADALANIELGQFYVRGLSRVSSGNVILLTLELDLNGILNVSAKEKRTGLEKSIVIDNAISRFEENELVQARERVHSLFSQSESEEQVDIQHQVIVQAQALIEKAERMLDKASSDDKEDIIALIEEIKTAIAQNNLGALKKPADQLSDILYYMES